MVDFSPCCVLSLNQYRGPDIVFYAGKDKVKNDEVNPDEPNLSVLQFYLREVEGIFTDQPDYETGEQKYHAVVEIGEQVFDRTCSCMFIERF